jgi:hypothetical protein
MGQGAQPLRQVLGGAADVPGERNDGRHRREKIAMWRSGLNA